MAKANKDNIAADIPEDAAVEGLVEDQITGAEAAEVVAEKHAVSSDAQEMERQVATAKSGKRSAKSLAEAEADAAKEVRKADTAEREAEEADKPKQHHNPTRSRLERQGKNYRKAAEQIEKGKVYSLPEAITLAVATNPASFDATVELHINLNVDPRHADQNIRDNFVLPQGTGRTVRVAVFADVDDAAKATAAGADISGIEAVTQLLEKGSMDFDTLIATPSQMAKLGKYARTLGPRGLMPNPKSGTVTTDVAKAVKEAKAGRVEYRVDSTGIVHLGIGKVSFGADRLADNAAAAVASIKGNKPASVKSNYVRAIHLTTSMGPSIKVETSAAS